MPTTAQYSGLHATRGIEAATGTQGLLYSYNTPNSALSGTSIRFDSGGAVPVSSNLFVSGSLGGGWFRMVYVGIPNAPILTIASYGPGPLNLGQYGSLPIDINTAFGLMDYYGTLTGTPNPAAVTDSGCGQNSVQFWVNQSSLPSGVTFWLLGLGFDALAPNSVADISNGLQVTTP
jgi:hypothetical protein